MTVNEAREYALILDKTRIVSDVVMLIYINDKCDLVYNCLYILKETEILSDFNETHWPIKTILNCED